MAKNKIELKHITKQFTTRRKTTLAVDDINFALKDGEFVSLVGPSGCGKSTIIRMIDGIINPSSGEITIDDITYSANPSKEILKKYGFIFQSPNLLPWMTVRENLILPLKIFEMMSQEDLNRIEDLLKMVGLSEYENAYPIDLSIGMQQRLGVIRAMVHNPELLMMDEPFGALDVSLREKMDIETLRIWKETGKTIIFITHNVEEAVLLSDRVIVMGTNPGRIVESVDITFPRPRTLDMPLEKDFQNTVEYIVSLIGELDLSNLK